jgi:hypothetical protein
MENSGKFVRISNEYFAKQIIFDQIDLIIIKQWQV